MESKQQFELRGFLKSLTGYSMASWAQAIISFLCIPLITRIFPTEEYGRISMLMLTINCLTIIVRLSTEQSYIRFYSERSADGIKSLLTQCTFINVMSYIIVFAAFCLFYRPLSILIFGNFNIWVMLLFIPIIVLFNTFSEYQRIHFKMEGKVWWYFVFALFGIVANKLSLVGAVFTKPTYVQAALFMSIAYSIQFIVIKILQPKSFSLGTFKLDKSELKRIGKYSLPFLPTTVIIYANSALVSFLLKSYLDYSSLAIYSATLSIANTVAIFQSGFAIYWGPFVYNNYKTQQEVIKKVHSWVSFIMTGAGLVIILCSDFLFYILGSDYRSGKAIFALLLIPQILTVFSETTCYGIYLSQKSYLQMFATVFSFVSNALIGIIFIPSFGLLGAAMANVIGQIIAFALRTYFGQKEYESTEHFWRTIVSILILCAGGATNYFFINNLMLKNLSIVSLILLLCVIYITELRSLVSAVSVFRKRQKQ